MPTVLWQRVQVREYIEIVKERRAFADSVFSTAMIIPYSKNEPPSKCMDIDRLLVAHTLYSDLLSCDLSSTAMIPAISGEVDDISLTMWYASYLHGVKINLVLLKLLIAEQASEDPDTASKYFQHILNSPTVMESIPEYDALRMSMYEQLLAIAKFSVEDYEEARHLFDCALEKDPSSKVAKLGGYWCDNHIFYKTSIMEPRSTKEDDMRDFMDLVPRKPFLELEPEPVSVLASLDEDLYILELLGYNGDVLEGRVQQKHGYSLGADGGKVNRPFDQASLKRSLDPMLEARAKVHQQGRKNTFVEVKTRVKKDAPLPISFPGMSLAPYAWNDTIVDTFSVSPEELQAMTRVLGPFDANGMPEGLMQMMAQMTGC